MPVLCLASLWPGLLGAQVPAARPAAAAPAASAPAASRLGQVVVAGTVPDESTRQAILARVRELYGNDRVVDQLGVGNLVAPPNWSQHVQRALHPDLKQVSRGQLSIQGNVLEIKGEVSNEAQRQQVLSQIATQLNNPTYTVRNSLRVSAAGQEVVDAALANRIVEFEPSSATLTATGQAVLDQLAPVLLQLSGRKFEVIGHTDALGARAANVALSAARAETVKAYLAKKGVPEANITTSGVGPDRPVADNNLAEGRARNRRIEFRVSQ
ncbi:OmpA family protein [Ideonella paludis]|uniref:OmpA family protein n=2 Tax=Ideonella paludis TaxID=1233411 RepID=A0ABS5E1X5_9BURK|nr:OmpA family protein [Ideonella paludis]